MLRCEKSCNRVTQAPGPRRFVPQNLQPQKTDPHIPDPEGSRCGKREAELEPADFSPFALKWVLLEALRQKRISPARYAGSCSNTVQSSLLDRLFLVSCCGDVPKCSLHPS